MEFKEEQFVEREEEIACYLVEHLSLKLIAVKTGLNRKILMAHLRNMMQKVKAGDLYELIQSIKKKKAGK